MFDFIRSKFSTEYHTTYAINRFKAWWQNHGCNEFNSKQMALLQWASSPARGMPDWDDEACLQLKEWANE